MANDYFDDVAKIFYNGGEIPQNVSNRMLFAGLKAMSKDICDIKAAQDVIEETQTKLVGKVDHLEDDYKTLRNRSYTLDGLIAIFAGIAATITALFKNQ